jgi:hypothetical protein
MNPIPIDNLRILKVATCPSLSRASQITYHLALKEEQVYLRIAGNSGGGLFAKECVALEAIITAIQAQGDQPHHRQDPAAPLPGQIRQYPRVCPWRRLGTWA